MVVRIRDLVGKVFLKKSPWENERMKGMRLRDEDKLRYMMLIAIAQDTLCLFGGGGGGGEQRLGRLSGADRKMWGESG